jgi:hypothetical protein
MRETPLPLIPAATRHKLPVHQSSFLTWLTLKASHTCLFLKQQSNRPTRDNNPLNEFRARVVPLNAVAAKQARRIVERAKRLGAWRPEHYIFPFRLKRGSYDVAKPASPYFIRSAFRSMRETTGLDWLQPRNFRNQIITKLFESGAPDETIILPDTSRLRCRDTTQELELQPKRKR